MFRLNDVQIDRSGDGFKNYYTFAYYFQYGKDLWFDGMQYPYGDYLLYADAQIPFVVFFKFLKEIGIDFGGKELFLIQFLPIINIFFSLFLVKEILYQLEFKNWFSFPISIFCVALNPQIFRINCHYALSYSFCFLLTFYLLLIFRKDHINWKQYFFINLLALFFLGVLHPYNLLISAFFLLAVFLVSTIREQFLWVVLSSALASVGLFLVFNNYLDPFTDRPGNPWNDLSLMTTLRDFLPFEGWIKTLLSHFFETRDGHTERYCYIGVLLFIIPSFLFKLIKDNTLISKYFRDYFLASILLLLFSMGIHLTLTNNQIIEYLPILKQFRTLGRFSWPFYYLAFIGTAIFAYNAVRQMHNKIPQYLLLSLIVGLWFSDAYFYLKEFNQRINKYQAPNELYENHNLKSVLDNSKYRDDNFQAILTLPLSIEGAEKIITQDNWFAKTESMPLSFQKGIPMFGAYMSRTSLSRILKQLQLTSSPYVEKEIATELSSEDILLVCHKSDTLLFKDILVRAYPIGNSKENTLWGMKVDSLLTQTSPMLPDSIGPHFVVYNNFEKNNQKGLLDEGRQVIKKQQFNLCDTIIPEGLNKLVVSVWQKIEAKQTTTSFFDLSFYNGDQLITKINYRDRDIKRMEVVGSWVQLKKSFTIPVNADRVVWNIYSDYLFIDHALITLGDSRVYIPLNDDYAIYDHYIIKRSKDQ